MIVKIDGTKIKSPHELKMGKFRLSKSGRTSDGSMKMEIIAIKTRIDLTWKGLAGADLQQILQLLDANTFYTIEYPDPNNPTAQSTMKAYVGDVNLNYFRGDSKRVWKDVTLPFIQQ